VILQDDPAFVKNANLSLTIVDGQRVLDHDMTEISLAWKSFSAGQPIGYESAWSVPLSRIVTSQEMRFNPLRFAPLAEQALAKVVELSGNEEWVVEQNRR